MRLPIYAIALAAALSCQAAGLRHAIESVPRAGLGHVVEKIRQGREITVVYFGGSITAMDGWRNLTFEWLKGEYPQARFRMVKAALGGTSSYLGVFRCGHDVTAHDPDLVCIEFSVNDSEIPDERIWADYDGIVRQIWRHDPETDIVCCYSTAKGASFEENAAGFLSRSQTATDRVAEYYGLPSVSFGPRVASEVEAGRFVMSLGEVGDVAPLRTSEGVAATVAGLKARGLTLFAEDGVHPTMDGHALYLTSFTNLWHAAKLLPPADRADSLARPFYSDALDAAKLVSIDESMLVGSWHRLPAGRDSRDLMWWYGERVDSIWEATTPGDSIRFSFRGSICKIYDLMGPNGGLARIRVDGKELPQRAKRFDSYCIHHRLAEFPVFEGEHGIHSVEIELDGETPDRKEILLRHPNVDISDRKFKGTSLLVGGILLVGDIVAEPPGKAAPSVGVGKVHTRPLTTAEPESTAD